MDISFILNQTKIIRVPLWIRHGILKNIESFVKGFTSPFNLKAKKKTSNC